MNTKKSILNAIYDYLDAIKTDHENHWSVQNSSKKDDVINIFNNRVRFEECGEKYYRVLVENEIHSFIMAVKDKAYDQGDILKPKTKSLPDRTEGCIGNIFRGDYNVKWTGV